MITMVAITWYLPESTRWLITKKRYVEARALILEASRVNSKHVPEHLLIVPNELELREQKASETVIDVICSGLLIKRLSLLCLVWLTVNMYYHGLAIPLSDLTGDFYSDYLIETFIVVPGPLFGMYFMDKAGRRMTVSGSLVLSGIALLSAELSPADPVTYRTVLYLLCKFFNSCCVAGIYLFTSELFPTAARTAVMGLCSTSGLFAYYMAPLIIDLRMEYLPAIIFSIICIVVAILVFCLPETNKLPLPSNIQEAKEQSWNMDFWVKCKQSYSATNQ